MVNRKRQSEAACLGKQAFQSRGEAGRAIHSERMKKAGAHPYRCPVCRLWHMGSHAIPRKVGVRGRPRLEEVDDGY